MVCDSAVTLMLWTLYGAHKVGLFYYYSAKEAKLICELQISILLYTEYNINK